MIAQASSTFNQASLLMVFITMVASLSVIIFIYLAFKKMDEDETGSDQSIFFDAISNVFGESINMRDIRVNGEQFLKNTNETLKSRPHFLVLNGKRVAVVCEATEILDNRAVFRIEALPSSLTKVFIKKMVNGSYRLSIEPMLLNNVVVGSRHFYLVERRK